MIEGSAAELLHRCPLWFGRVNRWILRRSLRGLPTDVQILAEVEDALACWFKGWPWDSDPLLVNVRDMARRRPLALPLDCRTVASLDRVLPNATLRGDSFASVAVEFVYFGSASAMPWPALDSSKAWRHFDCSWLLDVAGVDHGN